MYFIFNSFTGILFLFICLCFSPALDSQVLQKWPANCRHWTFFDKGDGTNEETAIRELHSKKYQELLSGPPAQKGWGPMNE